MAHAWGISTNTLVASQCCVTPHLPPAQDLVLENSFLVTLSRLHGTCKSTLQCSGSIRHECKWENHSKCSLPVLQGNPCQRAPPPCKCHTRFSTPCWRKKLPEEKQNEGWCFERCPRVTKLNSPGLSFASCVSQLGWLNVLQTYQKFCYKCTNINLQPFPLLS